MLVKVNEQTLEVIIYSIELLRRDNPNTSFPSDFNETTLAEFGVYNIERPEPLIGYDPETESLELPPLPTYLGGGLFSWSYVATPLDQETLDQIKAIRRDGIIQERKRRLTLGFDYDFGDQRGVHRIGTTDQDMKGWDEVSTIAGALISTGAPSALIQIVTDTGPVEVTALEWQGIVLGAANFRQPIWTASFVLQTSNPIPSNYTDNIYWP